MLRQLGWRIEESRNRPLLIHGGLPCRRASLHDAWDAGDLQVRLPSGLDRDARRKALLGVLDSDASTCAFGFKLGAAVKRATARLQGNPHYRFTGLQLGWIGFGWRGAKAQGWERFRSFGRGYRPAGRNSVAIDAFYGGHVRSECGVGRQVAQLATLRELYGDQAFDQAFTAGELSIGTFMTLHRTDSILLGRNAGEFFADGRAKQTSAMGRQAFMAAPGFIEHVFPPRYLDDINNQAENFVVVDIDAAAADVLAAHDGFAYYDQRDRVLWRLSQQLDAHGSRYFQRLLLEHDPDLRGRLDDRQRAVVAQMDALLADPFYRGFRIYVHPKGVRPIGFHIVRLLDRNPRTPFAIELTLHNLHTTVYWRWVAEQLRTCSTGVHARD